MRNAKMANGLVLTWVPVTDAQGRTHPEAHWTQLPQAPQTSAPAHAA